MADSLDARHGTSDEYYDPFCDLCFKTKGHNVKACGYCKECFQFLCTDCNVFHVNLQGTRGHIVLRGEDMPQSQAANPPRFEDCDVHPKQINGQFCFEHQLLLCSICSSSNHKTCSVLSVDDACKHINGSDVDALYDSINGFKTNLETVVSTVATNVKTVKTEKENMLKEAQILYQKIISKADKLIQELKADIETKYQSYLSVLSKHQKQINDVVSRLDASLNDIALEKGKSIDTNLFLRVHDTLSYKYLCKTDIEDLKRNLRIVSLSLAPNKEIQDFLSSSSVMGTVSTTEYTSDVSISMPDINFPASPPLPPPATSVPTSSRPSGTTGTSKSERGSQQLAALCPRKLGTYQVKLDDDKQDCWITGITVTKDGRKLLADNCNLKVKLFSREMKCLSSVSLSDQPWDVVMIGDQVAAVSMYGMQLVILQVSDRQLVVKDKIQFSFIIKGLTPNKDKFVITTSTTTPPSVMLRGKSGRACWSVSTDHTGQPLFKTPWYVHCYVDGKSSSAIVTDHDKHTLTLLNGDTGEVITRRQLDEKHPRGITTDTTGNVYVCYYLTYEVAVLSGDMCKERILLSKQNGLTDGPQAIAYDDVANQLIISYCNKNYIDRYQL